jgi:hypothetical protein
MFQQEIKETVQRANAAIATEGGERVTRRHYGDHELAKVPRGCPVGPGVDDPIEGVRDAPCARTLTGTRP